MRFSYWTSISQNTSHHELNYSDVLTIKNSIGNSNNILSLTPQKPEFFIRRALWRPGRSQLAVTYFESSDLAIVDATTGNVQYVLKTPSKVAPALGVTDLAWSANGQFLASAFEDNAINIWDLSSDTPAKPLVINHEGRAPFISWSADGSKLASAWGNDDRQILIWDAKTGALLKVLDDASSRFNWVLWSPNGKILATSTWNDGLKLWDAQSYQVIASLGENTIQAVSPFRSASWSPDSKTLADIDCFNSSGGCLIWTWDVVSGEIATPFHYEPPGVLRTAPLRWSPNGKYLAASDESRQVVYIWDTTTKTLIETLDGFPDSVTSLSWSSDSRLLATTANAIKLWHIPRFF